MLAIRGGPPVLSEPVQYCWPKVLPESERLVLAQLRSAALSVYDKSGVIGDFEDHFAALHSTRYGLVTSSGTAALHSAFYGLGIGPGDEVLCPTYTFFATAVPLFQLGSLPVLVDCTPDGSFDVAAAESAVGPRTKAVVVTHMWGLPCDMRAVTAFCGRHGLALVEDCSHAHGARFDGQLTGTFGAAGAWSLQTQKLIAAGEGGILLTDDREIYDRAQLLGHFNKRAVQEMDPDGSLYKYSSTGLGLKYRAHPLGIAFALGQLPHLEEWIASKQLMARRLSEELERLPGVTPIGLSDETRTSAYYALVLKVDSRLSGFRRDSLVQAMHAEGFEDADVPKATAPLHTLEAFRDPISPVYTYDRSCLSESRYEVADTLASTTFKVSVPAGIDTNEDDRFKDSLGRVVDKLLDNGCDFGEGV